MCKVVASIRIVNGKVPDGELVRSWKCVVTVAKTIFVTQIRTCIHGKSSRGLWIMDHAD